MPDPADVRRSLRKHWRDILEVDSANAGQNFFDLGGDSLAAMELAARVHEDTGWELPLEILFRDGTLSGLESHCG